MKTKKNISNIAYNTLKFLDMKCKELYDNGTIMYYMYIFHKKEKDEKSDHFHLILFPSNSITTEFLDKEFTEPCDDELPLGCSKLWKTETKDGHLEWILYVLHDEVYLKSKNKGPKKYHYTVDEIVSPDKRTFDDLIFQAFHETEIYSQKNLTEMIIKNNMNGHDLIKNGYIPIKSACGFHHYLQMLKGG